MSTATKDEVISHPELIAKDDRGVIEQLVKGDFQSVLRTTQKKGSVRANHYHKHDSHIGYVVSGRVEYMTRPVRQAQGKPAVDESAPLKKYILEPGQMFYTPPMVAHATVALEDSDILYFTPRSGNQEEYEDDVIRVELISPAEAARLAKVKRK